MVFWGPMRRSSQLGPLFGCSVEAASLYAAPLVIAILLWLTIVPPTSQRQECLRLRFEGKVKPRLVHLGSNHVVLDPELCRCLGGPEARST